MSFKKIISLLVISLSSSLHAMESITRTMLVNKIANKTNYNLRATINDQAYTIGANETKSLKNSCKKNEQDAIFPCQLKIYRDVNHYLGFNFFIGFSNNFVVDANYFGLNIFPPDAVKFPLNPLRVKRFNQEKIEFLAAKNQDFLVDVIINGPNLWDMEIDLTAVVRG